ncbi:MAG: hypothetical protein LBI69_01730 [Puniceicoccales bacterium]|nr:hypothetical protein [Puniceicoccales bacterium]
MEFTIDANGSDKSRNIFTPPDEGGSPTQPYDIIKKGNSNKDAEFQSNLEAIQSEMNAFARKQDKKQKDRPIAKIVF